MFKVGDVVTAIDDPHIEPRYKSMISKQFTIVTANIKFCDAFGAHWPDSVKHYYQDVGCFIEPGIWANNSILRKIDPPCEMGSWDEIEKLTKWNPNHLTIPV